MSDGIQPEKYSYRKLIDDLGKVSGAMAVFALAFYVLGFLVESIYLAGFGFTSYEILSARFISVGIISASVFVGVFFLIMQVQINANSEDSKRFFNMSIVHRSAVYLIMLLSPWLVAASYTTIFHLADGWTLQKTGDIIFFGGFGKYDLIGMFVQSIKFSASSPSIEYVVKMIIYAYGYAAIVISAYYFIRTSINILIRFIRWVTCGRVFRAVNDLSHSQGTREIEISPSEKATRNGEDVSSYVRSIRDLYVDALGVVSVLVVYIYACKKLSAERLITNNFTVKELSIGTCYAWVVFILYTYSFLRIAVSSEIRELRNPRIILVGDVLRYIVAPAVLALGTFGQVIYPRIPYALGGGTPREVKITFEESKIPNIGENDRVFLVDETSEYYFLVIQSDKGNRAFEQRKDAIESLQMTVREK